MPSIKPTVRTIFKHTCFLKLNQVCSLNTKRNVEMQALRFYGSFNVTVTGITVQNSQQCHLKFDNCIGVAVYNFTASSPGDSPNTDGIHLQNSKDALIRSSNIACGNYCTQLSSSKYYKPVKMLKR